MKCAIFLGNSTKKKHEDTQPVPSGRLPALIGFVSASKKESNLTGVHVPVERSSKNATILIVKESILDCNIS
jgi:hypothetical protein